MVCGTGVVYMGSHIPGETPPNYVRVQIGCICNGIQIFHPKGDGFYVVGAGNGVIADSFGYCQGSSVLQ